MADGLLGTFEAEIREALGRIETEQRAIRRELLGNGQPGRIQMIETKVSEHAEFIARARGFGRAGEGQSAKMSTWAQVGAALFAAILVSATTAWATVYAAHVMK